MSLHLAMRSAGGMGKVEAASIPASSTICVSKNSLTPSSSAAGAEDVVSASAGAEDVVSASAGVAEIRTASVARRALTRGRPDARTTRAAAGATLTRARTDAVEAVAARTAAIRGVCSARRALLEVSACGAATSLAESPEPPAPPAFSRACRLVGDEHSRRARMSPWRAAGRFIARAATRGGIATSSRARADRAPWMLAAEARTRSRASAGWTIANTCSRRRGLSSHPPAPPSKASPSDGVVADVVAALPGLGLALAVSQAGFALADGISAAVGAPMAGVPCAVLLGAGINNAVALPKWVRPGLRTATGTVLRVGIVCVGAKLSASDVVSAGAFCVPAAAASVGAGLVLIPRVASIAGLHPRLGSLLAAGTSICGVTAVSALAPAIAATQTEVACAVANVVLWGSLAMLRRSARGELFVGRVPGRGGMWLGLAVHDTAQVMGAGLTYEQLFDDERAFNAAAVTKLTRNLALAAAIPALAVAHSCEKTVTASYSKVPGFLVAFVGMALVRSCGDAYYGAGSIGVPTTEDHGGSPGGPPRGAPGGGGEAWRRNMNALGDGLGAKACLATALAAVGLNTGVSSLVGVGVAPFAVGAVGSAIVGVGLVSALTLSELIRRSAAAAAAGGENGENGDENRRDAR